jgi:hypothetical protein
MTIGNLALMLQSAVLVAGIWAVLFWVWSSVRLDCYRQRMFEVRDELFDYALAGKISFNDPAYRLLRQSINGFIRYGHKVSFGQFLLTWLEWKASEGSDSFKWERKWTAALHALDKQTRDDLLEFHHRETMNVSERIILGSPVLIVVFVLSAVIALFQLGLKSVRELMTAALFRTANTLINTRILEEEAARAAA